MNFAPVRLVVHFAQLIYASLQFSVSTRRYSVLAVIVLGFILFTVVFAVHTVAPLALYPFV